MARHRSCHAWTDGFQFIVKGVDMKHGYPTALQLPDILGKNPMIQATAVLSKPQLQCIDCSCHQATSLHYADTDSPASTVSSGLHE